VEWTLAIDFLKETKLSSTGEVIRALISISLAVPVLLQVLQLSLTFGVGSAGCDRSFSSLARIKIKIRSTMTETRLADLAILSIERELSASIENSSATDRFAAVDQGRRLRPK
jgi:hypothetical protein